MKTNRLVPALILLGGAAILLGTTVFKSFALILWSTGLVLYYFALFYVVTASVQENRRHFTQRVLVLVGILVVCNGAVFLFFSRW